jgi:ubiquinone/menaquinone biosynthesis C-methylase UbiE
MKQKDIFLKEGEGDKWFSRNKSHFNVEKDPVLNFLQFTKQPLGSVLEVGCSNGWRLAEMVRRNICLASAACGVDPSREAISDGLNRWPQLKLSVGTADLLEFPAENFDTLIFGFCLYLVDSSDLFKVACEADRVLKKSGRIMILDFKSKGYISNPYSHYQGVYSRKMNYCQMFEWHPNYVLESSLSCGHEEARTFGVPGNLNDWISISTLKKID